MTVDSNISGLRFAIETSLGVLSGSDVWYPAEPNSYSEFGPQITTVARNPINASRQRRKGLTTDLDAVAGYTTDWLQKSLYRLMPAFFFAAWRAKESRAPTAVTTAHYATTAGTAFAAGELIFAEGFSTAANNGLKVVTGSASTEVQAAGLATEGSPPAGAQITAVGFQFASGDLVFNAQGHLTCTAGDFTTMGLIPGEWVFVGGDTAATQFATAPSGFHRIAAVAAKVLTLDRWPTTATADTGAGKTIQLFFGHVIKNESDPNLIVRTSVQWERSLGTGGWEYVLGAVANTLRLNVTSADKVTADLSFVGIDGEQRTTGEGAKAGTRPAIEDEEAFNSSSDFARLRMLNDDTGASLFTYLTELALTIDNGVTPAKSVATLGAFDMTVGDFMAGGSVTAYFASVEAVRAVRNNTSVSLDFAMVRSNRGWLFDLPYLTLGDGRLNVEKDRKITLPLSMDGAAHPDFDHTLLAQSFTYLPNVAA